ncbi:hypothetical protein SUGI_0202870 [Cryptomeria japonica]|uniref:transcription factor IBH1-like n=1 Tax=Cryptomeria japonica TaxID=3369 RepID=UPI002408D2D9|nr:transcription factor IBH1-like [Cryptomeria japonica]GLJ12998.1 hypothetical protein SUGI_0202870 [Cryptomeria japonica]
MNFLFRELYLKRLIPGLKNLQKPTSSSKGDESDNPCSSHNVKLAADVSLALTANRSAWGRALLSRISRDENNRSVLRKILEPKKFRAIMAQRAIYKSRFRLQSRRKLDHMKSHKNSSHCLYRYLCSARFDTVTSSNARVLNRRTRELQRLVPGGKSMGTACLLGETADYISCLKTQVEVLQSLVISLNDDQYESH